MKKTLALVLVVVGCYCLFPALIAQEARVNRRETDWSKQLAMDAGIDPLGVEYRLPNGSRVDIYDKANGIAWEVEWSDKWEEAVGQSLYYAIALDEDPGIWLLLRGNHDEDYLQCLVVVSHLRSKGIKVRFRTVRTR